MVHEPLTKLQCSPTSDGAGAAIVASERFVIENGLMGQAVEIIGQSMVTDSAKSFEADELHDRSVIDMVGFPMARAAVDDAYRTCELQVPSLSSLFFLAHTFCDKFFYSSQVRLASGQMMCK